MVMLGSLACTSDRTSALSTALRPYTIRQSGCVVIRRQSRAAYFLVLDGGVFEQPDYARSASFRTDQRPNRTTPRPRIEKCRLTSSLRQESARSIQNGPSSLNSAKDDVCACRRNIRTYRERSALRDIERKLSQMWNGDWIT